MSIVLESVSKDYGRGRRKVRVLSDIDLTIETNEFVFLSGQSGSGKTTLLSLIGGIDTPTSGRILVNNTDITRLGDAKLSSFRSNTIGFVFQNFYLQPYLTAQQNIQIASIPSKTTRRAIAERLDTVAEALNITDKLKNYPSQLSGGQTQRVAIARALFNSPSVILADEPTANLDDDNTRAVIQLLLEARNSTGATLIVAGHDSRISGFADRTIKLADGRVVA